MSVENYSSTNPESMIHRRRQRAQQTRELYYEHRLAGETPPSVQKQLALCVLEYHDVLREFRNSPAVDEEDYPDISPIRNRLGEYIEVVANSKRLGQSTTMKSLPAVIELPDHYLIRMIDQLDDLAQNLGFGAEASKSTPHNEAKREDLEALLQSRGQENAVGKLPGGG